MAAWTLSSEQWDALDRLRFATTDAALFRNATIILMSAVGRSKFAIAADLGCSPATVDNARQRYRAQGVAGLELDRDDRHASVAQPLGQCLNRLAGNGWPRSHAFTADACDDVNHAVDGRAVQLGAPRHGVKSVPAFHNFPIR